MDLLILDFTGLNPSLDLVPVPLELLDLLLQVRLKLLLLVRIVCVINLSHCTQKHQSVEIPVCNV